MIKVKRPKRWDKPFSETMDDKTIEHVLSFHPFNQLDENAFSSTLPLKGIIANDCRVVSFLEDELIVRKGEYGGSAFLTLQGQVCAVTHDFSALPNESLFNFFNSKADDKHLDFPLFIADEQNSDEHSHLKISAQFKQFLQQNPQYYDTVDKNDFYGLAALIRGTRQSNLFTTTPAEVLEIRWQGLRDLMRYDAGFRQYIQELYKSHNLLVQVRTTPIFSHLKSETLNKISHESLFASYGEFEWHRSFKNILKASPAERLQAEPIIAKENHYADGLLLICSGFARLTKKINHGEKTIGYLKQGDVFGFEELAHNWKNQTQLPYQHTLRAIGYVDVIRISTTNIEQYVLPTLKKTPTLKNHDSLDYGLDTGILEQLVEKRFINGTSTMIIDRYRCTGCDDCVNACAALHDDIPRFKRSGELIDRYQVTYACMHCTDPVCLIGCPTGAIHRQSQDGHIVVDETTCIGCSGCATSCPYENIFMTEVFNNKGQMLLDEQTAQPLLKANKCDLCEQHGGIPACEQACPHDALKRLDMGNIASFVDWFNRY